MAESDRVSKKDLYKEAWEGHNFEISHLWQNYRYGVIICIRNYEYEK